MKTRKTLLFSVVLLAGVLVWALTGREPSATHNVLNEIVSGELKLWSSLDGTLRSRQEWPIVSALSQQAIVTYLVPEGTVVQAGDLVASFDQTALQREMLELEKNAILAKAQVESLTEAELPLELMEIKTQIEEQQTLLQVEEQYLADTEALQVRELVSAQEVEQQQSKVYQIRKRIARLEKRLMLTREFIHPSRLTRARASLNSAERELALAHEQLEHCQLTAERPGMAVYQPVFIDNEFRNLEPGDATYRNQKFMILADMSNLVVDCLVPESQLSLVSPGSGTMVIPEAFPTLRLNGTVESVGAMAHNVSGRPTWQKYFNVRIRLLDFDPKLRSGMSVAARVLSYHKREALLIPRDLVSWKDGTALCRKVVDGKIETVAIRTGRADSIHLEVLEGLQAGDWIARP